MIFGIFGGILEFIIVFLLIGLIVYKANHWMLYAMHETITCPHCGKKTVKKFDNCIHSGCKKPLQASNIQCPSCGKETLFKSDDEKLCYCRWCKTLILENDDGTYRAHTPKVDAS